VKAIYSAVLSTVLSHLRDPFFWKGIIVAVLVGLLAKTGQWLWGMIVETWRSRQAFDITGSWMGDCLLPSYTERQLEIWRYTRKGDDVKLKFFAYDPSGAPPSRWIGAGVYRGSKLSAYYYRLAQGTYESGVVALELKALGLKGMYGQFDPKVKEEPLYVSNADYTQRRVELAFLPRMKMLFGLPPLPTYAEVKRLYGPAS
jgi:hypothetical protein